ncbi:MAG: CDP-glycerol glycerophosphotransferase family protein [Coriobacteriales bacterium]|nr:CDP-glycerol glycerophosphotransferase family protein [Coriobacteriales bacterium]
MRFYIDPGTGSMLFAILIGIVGALNYVFRVAIVKLRFLLSGGKNVSANDKVIPYAIFSDDKRYWNVFEPLCREFSRRGIDVVYLTASPDDPALSCQIPHVEAKFLGAGQMAFAKLNLIKATMVISTTPGLDVYQWKRSKDAKCYVHVLHAAGEVVLYRMFGLDYYDAVLVAGTFQQQDIRDLEELRGLPAKDIALAGIPYMDVMAARLKESGPVPEHPRTVLLAPSWGPSAIFARFGGQIIERLLATGYHVIVRPHPQSFKSEKDLIDTLMADYPASDQLEWNRDVDNFDCLRRSDVLVSDFSGVVFDFALVYDKPVIYTDPNFDLAPYDAWWLKRELWTQGALPRLGMQLTEEGMEDLKSLIDTCLEDPRFAQGRDQVRQEAWQCYGQGAQKTVDYLVAKHGEVVKQAQEVA